MNPKPARLLVTFKFKHHRVTPARPLAPRRIATPFLGRLEPDGTDRALDDLPGNERRHPKPAKRRLDANPNTIEGLWTELARPRRELAARTHENRLPRHERAREVTRFERPVVSASIGTEPERDNGTGHSVTEFIATSCHRPTCVSPGDVDAKAQKRTPPRTTTCPARTPFPRLELQARTSSSRCHRNVRLA